MEKQEKKGNKIALLGYCVPAMEAMDSIGRDFVVVVPKDFKSLMEEIEIPHVSWDFNIVNDQSHTLAKTLSEMGVSVAVPLFEETVEWAGALNGFFRDDPRLFTRYLLFRDKAMMKRRAQMNGIRVGVFEEADDKDDVYRFLKRVNKALVKIEGDIEEPIHLKPLAAAGSVGHRMIRTEKDVHELEPDEFPCLLESHLDGQEFSCEVFIHNKKIQFLNITEYVRLGYSNFCPASPELNQSRELIEKAVYDLIDAFDIQYGMIHPEFFITPDGKINFGEVAARVPGGHIFELIEKAYGFNPFAGFALCCDPDTPQRTLDNFFPNHDNFKNYAGCLMVYPKEKIVTRVDLPKNLLTEEYYDHHNLFQPVNFKVAERAGFGNHYGTVYFTGGKADQMRKLLKDYEQESFYASQDSPSASEASQQNP